MRCRSESAQFAADLWINMNGCATAVGSKGSITIVSSYNIQSCVSKPMMKLDAKTKRKISNDWIECFPLMSLWKPMWLLKRHGPLLVGICLDRDRTNEQYTPRAHFHSLCAPVSTILLGLVGEVELRGVPVSIRCLHHDQQYQSVADELGTKFPFLRNKRLEFSEYLLATKNYLEGKHGKTGKVPFQHAPWEDLVLVASYMGRFDYAETALESFANSISKWPDRGLNNIGSADAWRRKLEWFIKNPDALHANVEAQVKDHKLDHLVDYGLEWSDTLGRF